MNKIYTHTISSRTSNDGEYFQLIVASSYAACHWPLIESTTINGLIVNKSNLQLTKFTSNTIIYFQVIAIGA